MIGYAFDGNSSSDASSEKQFSGIKKPPVGGLHDTAYH